MSELERIENELFNAVLQGDLEETKRITAYLSSSRPWHPGNDLLCAALAFKYLDIARLFLSQGSEVVGDRRNYGGFTAIHLAVMYGDSSIVEMILRKDAFVNSLNQEGMIPLHLIVYRNQDEFGHFLPPEIIDEESSIIINNLLQRGSDINTPVVAKAKNGFTTLHLAAECGNENIIQILLNRNANLNICDRGGVTPLHIAAIHGRVRIVKMFLDYGAIAFSRDIMGKSPLCWAIEKKHLQIVEMLINYQPPPSLRSYTNLPKLLDDRNLLLSAIHSGDVSIVQSLLNKGVAVQSAWKSGETALHIAVKRKFKEIVKLLLDRGANLRAVTEDGKTPLYLAVEKRVVEIVDILLRFLKDNTVFLIGPSKCTPLHVAVMSDDEEMVRLLLLKGSLIYRKILGNSSHEMSSESLLHVAAKNGSLPICKLLLDHDADIDSKDARGRNALYFAAERGSWEVVNELCDISLKKKPSEEIWKEGYPALYVAAYYGNDQIVHLLLEKGVDVKANIKGYSTPLHAATERNHEKIVESLLENGFDVNERRSDSRDDRTALHCAVEKGFATIVDHILRKDADVNAKITEKRKAGYTPLHCAAEAGNLQIVEKLVEKNADVNAKDDHNCTPLFLAVNHKKADVVQYLVDHGADVKIFAEMDKILIKFNFSAHCINRNVLCTSISPLTLAVVHNQKNIVDVLLKNGAADDMENEAIPPMHMAAENNVNCEIVRKLLQYKANVNSQCSTGFTPLFHAVYGGQIETIKLLIKNGADLHTKNKEGNSLLHIAAESSRTNMELIKILLECGLDVKARNVHQKTPLLCFPYAEDNIFELLLDYGSEVNTQDKMGNTPLHIAISKFYGKAAVAILLEYGADINAVNHEGKTALEVLLDSHHENVMDEISPHFPPLWRESGAELIVQVIVIRQSVGLHVSKKNLQFLNREEVKYYYQECKTEFDEKISTEVCKNVSFSDILTKNTNKLDAYFRNPAIIKSLESTDFTSRFPTYAPIFKIRVQKAKERKLLLESSIKPLESILDFEFPSLIVQHIFSFLSSVDLKNMSRVFQRPPRFVPRLCKPSD